MSDEEIIDFLKWYTQLPGRYKIFVPGNHDMLFETEPERAKLHFPTSVTLLEDCGVKIDNIYFFGVTCRPWRFENSEYDLPKEVDFLITHAPAKGHLDNNTGCEILKQMIDEGKPKYHIFGHIHELGLQQEVTPDTTYLNVSYYNQLLHHYTMHESLELENSGRR
jgi:predicted phosphohydrolase